MQRYARPSEVASPAEALPRRLLDQVRGRIRRLGLAKRTEAAYVGWIRHFILANGKRRPREMGEVVIERFLTRRATADQEGRPNLDTHTVSHALRAHPGVIARLTREPMASLAVSVITEAELNYGLAKRPEALRLRELVEAFVCRVDVLPWDRTCAARYGALRQLLVERGTPLAPWDLLIATHALAVGATLVSSDQALRHCPDLEWEDWMV